MTFRTVDAEKHNQSKGHLAIPKTKDNLTPSGTQVLRFCRICKKKAYTINDLQDFKIDNRKISVFGRSNICKKCDSEQHKKKHQSKRSTTV